MKYAFTQVDVFTELPMRGNPLAVVQSADGLSDAQMQCLNEASAPPLPYPYEMVERNLRN